VKEFIKNKLRENLQPEKIDTSKIKIKKNFTNGLLVFLPFYEGNRMGSFRLEPFNDDYKIFGTVLYDRFKGQGLGKGMYKYIIRQLKKEGKKLYSDDNQSPDAVNVWNSLVKDGLAITTDTGFVSI
jgi:GNAT superfamily N-acetyltransferase